MKMLSNFKKLSFIILTCALSSPAFACKVNTPKIINMGVSTTDSQYFSYGLKSLDQEVPYSVVNGCADTAAKRKYLMVTFGPEVVEASDAIRGTNYNRQFADAYCSIKNNPLKTVMTHDQAKAAFEKKWKYIQECVEIQVTDVGTRPLSYPTDQEGCKVTPVSQKSAIFRGGYCFFKPSVDSEFNVLIGISKACQGLAAYKDLKVNLQDINANLNFYTSSQYNTDDLDLTALATTPVRISTNPVKPILTPSEDYGIVRPVFPAVFPVGDVHLGQMTFSPSGTQYIAIKTPFIVSNVCKEVEANGVKSSSCDYATPYVAEVTLKNSKNQVEATWFDGGIANAQWQGIINGEGFQVMKDAFPTNKVYRLEINFADPYYDFNYFKGRIKNKIGLVNARLPLFNNDGSIREINDFRDIEEIDQMIEVAEISSLNFKDRLLGLANGRRRLSGFFSTTMYPPIYTNACNIESGACTKLGKSFVKFVATFLLKDDYSIADLKVERESALLGSYVKNITEQPEFVCE